MKYIVAIGHLIKEENYRNRMEYKRRKDTTRFFWALGHESTNEITPFKYRTEPDKIKIDKLIKLYNILLAEKKQIQLTRRLLPGETNRHENTGRQLGETD